MFYAVLAIIVLAFGLVGFKVMSGPNPAKSVKRRMEVVRERHAEGGALKANAQMQIRKLMAKRKAAEDGGLAKLLPRPALLKLRLSQTGKKITLQQYAMYSLVLGAVVAAMLMLRGAPFFLAFFVALLAATGIPHFVVGFLIKKRLSNFNDNFPDAIELMVRGLRSGLPITETLGIVSNELPGPVGDEFKSVTDKMKVGKTMEASLQETADRLGTPEFQFFVITLAIQRETGGNLAETLSNLADVLRKRAQMKLKIRAMSSESKASALIVGSLPFIVFGLIWMINPSYMGGFFVDQRLMVAGIGGLCWMSIGAFMMAKMVNFEI